MSLGTSARPPTSLTPPLRTAEKEAVRALLDEHRSARMDQIQAHTFADPHDSDLDPGARMRVLVAAEQCLREIDSALLRLDDGSYGLCVGCTEPIATERLLAVPYARHCIRCA